MSNKKTPNSLNRLEKFRAANTTLRPRGPQMADVSGWNGTRPHYLDETLARGNPAAAADAFEVSMAYNRYLQALLKQQLADEQISQHEQCTNDQMLQQTLKLQMANDTLEETRSEMASFRKTVEINEWLQTLKNYLGLLEQSFFHSDVTDMQQDLTNIFSNQLGQISIINIKPIYSQDEFQQLQATFEDLKKILKRISDIHGNNLQEVRKLADLWKSLTVLHNEISATTQNITQTNRKVTVEFLVSASEAFAQAYD